MSGTDILTYLPFIFLATYSILGRRMFRRLPPLLRGAYVLGLLLVIASFIMVVALFIANWASYSQKPANDARVIVIALNLVTLSLACSAVVNAYARRFYHPDRRPFPLDSWQSQARALALLAALPLCAIILAAVLSPALSIFGVAFGVSVLGPVVLVGAYFAMIT